MSSSNAKLPPPTIHIDTTLAVDDASSQISPSVEFSPSTPSTGMDTQHLAPTSPTTASRRSSTTFSTEVSVKPLIPPEELLKAALEEEPAGLLDGTTFKVSPKQLSLLNHNEQQALFIFHDLEGIEGISAKLETNVDTGLSVDEDFAARERVYGRNVLPDKRTKPLWKLIIIALSDKMLILLTVAAIVSFALGLYETLGTPTEYDREGNPEPKVDWIEGVAIMVAVVVVVLVGALNDWQKELQFAKLNKRKDDREVKVIRSGKTSSLSIFDVLPGDVMLLEQGDMVPVDGILIQGHQIRCDESAATGETDALKKVPAAEVRATLKRLSLTTTLTPSSPEISKLDPFILSGSKVLEGFGTFLVTAVGPNSANGKTMMDLRSDDSEESTPLQEKLNVIAETIAKWGGGASVLLFVILLLRFLGELPHNTDTSTKKGEEFLTFVITCVTLIAVAVPEGLPLAVTLALAFATKRMLRDNNLVRVLKSCETMGNATTICSDKTGTLTQNKMTVVAGSIGADTHFKADFGKLASKDSDSSSIYDQRAPSDTQIPITSVQSSISSGVKTLLLQSIYMNTTAFEDADTEEIFVGSKTETALLNFARSYLAMGPLQTEQSNIPITQLFPFDSSKKSMGVVISFTDSNGRKKFRLFVKGASEIVLAHSTSYISDIAGTSERDGYTVKFMPSDVRMSMDALITSYAEKSLRTIGLSYNDFDFWPPPGITCNEDDATQVKNYADVFASMTWIGLVGIMDPLRIGVIEAVQDCQRAGVVVRMVTGDNIVTAKAIATDCGIYTGGVVMQGPDFRAMDPKERDLIIPKLQVLARSSPQDKRLLVQRLKRMGETVAVTGDGTNDAPALTMADVGFSMGIAGTEVAKEASDIILMDDNFSSIVKALLWGRAVNDAVKKFLQFQVTVNIAAVLLTFVSAIQSSDGDSVMTAVQLLWVNLIMDTFAALALATDPPTRSLLDRPPSPRSEGLITVTMWKMMIGQAAYQLGATFVLHFAGAKIWGFSADDTTGLQQLDTMVFNAFVWMQFFNMFVNRRLDNKLNFFEGLSRNFFFMGIAAIMCGGQVLIMFVGGNAFSIERITGPMWAVSLVIGFVSIPVGVFLRICIPDRVAYAIYKPVGIVFRFIWGYISTFLSAIWKGIMFFWPFKKEKADSDEEEKIELRSPGGTVLDKQYQWNAGIEQIRNDLVFLKRVRGGRVNELKFRRPRQMYQHWKQSMSTLSLFGNRNDESRPGSPVTHSARRRSGSSLGALAMVPSIVGGAVAGWSPTERPNEGGQTVTSPVSENGYLAPPTVKR
ncbi:uncharacterized protein V1518DRAFT_409830 [Limtongia smithiae]|uniref:uncharacterized protein n=1 Tax=Limtongia smithiae TaxID=1125753 RepID=UPI0034CE47DA